MESVVVTWATQDFCVPLRVHKHGACASLNPYLQCHSTVPRAGLYKQVKQPFIAESTLSRGSRKGVKLIKNTKTLQISGSVWPHGPGLRYCVGSQWVCDPCDSTCVCTKSLTCFTVPSRNNPFLDCGRHPHSLRLGGLPLSPGLLCCAVVHL